MMKNLIKIAAVIAFVGVAAGCAHDNNQLQSKINDAMQTAQSAQSAASSAQSAADAAQSTANQANQTAKQALQAANQAKATAQANSKRIERAFEQSQRK